MIGNSFIPVIYGKAVLDVDRKIITLPYRYGGPVIRNPVKTCKDQYDQSVMITSELTRMICDQDMDFSRLNRVLVMTKK